jgi:hypothetical protein
MKDNQRAIVGCAKGNWHASITKEAFQLPNSGHVVMPHWIALPGRGRLDCEVIASSF